jgi:predicted acyltransferase
METKPIRFGALDVFRGLTIIFMIIVNSPGNWSFVYGPLQHAEWHGFTPTDLVFPSFLFAIGTAMSFSMRKWVDQPGGEVALQILKRTALLFLFGYLMYWYPFFRLDLNWNFSAFPISGTRIFGVLQRIALAYGIAAALLHFAGKKWTYTLVLISLPVYWIILEKFGMAGLDPLSLEGNAVRALDLKLIGANHMYTGEGIAFDPEGLLTTLPSIANIVAGYSAGLFVQRDRNEKNTRIDLMLVGASVYIGAMVWGLAFPINKKLWTSSYVLLTIGLDLVLLGLLMWFLPKEKKLTTWGKFFQTAGKNPLAIYLLSEIGLITLYTLPAGTSSSWEWLYSNGFAWMGVKLGSFIMAALFALLCWLVGYWMDKKRIYWRV